MKKLKKAAKAIVKLFSKKETKQEIEYKKRTLKFRELSDEEIESMRCKQYECIL